MADITMPQLGETVTEGTITRWAKQVGDEVAEDEVLFEVSTDKVDSEVPSPTAGYLSEILVPEGETVDVGTKLAVISAEAPGGGGGGGAPDAGSATAGEGGEAAPEAEVDTGEDAGDGAAHAVEGEAGAAAGEAGDGGAPADEAAPGETADALAERDTSSKPVEGAPSGRRAKEKAPAAAEPAGDGTDQTGPDQTGPDQTGPDQTGADEGEADQTGADEGEADQTGADESEADQTGADESEADESGADRTGAAASGGPSDLGSRRPAGNRPPDDRPPGRPSAGGGAGKVLSPVVRRLIAEHDLDPSTIQGTGAGGRISRSDVLAVIDRQGADGAARAGAASPSAKGEGAGGPAPAQGRGDGSQSDGGQSARGADQAAAPSQASAPGAGVTAGEHDEVVPFTNIRRRTAEHMVRSKQISAHTVVAMEVDFSGVERVRQAEKGAFKAEEGVSLTYLPFIARATVDAIRSWPHVNSSVGDDALIVHHRVHLGIAVDLDFEGLLVPVIHDADGKRLRLLAREVSTLATKARSKRLTMDDISGGTFTITNAGPFGTLFTVPVINQPQIAILATDGVRKKPVAVELPDGSDGIAVHPVGNLVLSFDHRAIDGAYAAAFMAELKEILESRDWSGEL